jgi:ribosomal protein L3 glutamine methyltransferase
VTTLEIPLDELRSLRDWVRWSASTFEAHGLFFGHGTDNAFDEALELVLATLHLDHSMPESFLDARVTRAEAAELARRLRRRVEDRVPLAHITGRAFFAGLVFEVNEHVLVPRSPIAELIEARFEPWLDAERVRSVLDLCTGSGCIGIACAHAFPEARVDLADISPEALEVAQRNIERHGLEERVRVVQSDVYAGLAGERYDLIVSNPPYVSEAEMATLPPEYHREPRLGLAAGEDGMVVVARILAEAPEHLNEGGILVCEVGASADLLMARYPDAPFLWLDFERGGDGVFLLTAGQLAEFHDVFVEG